MSLKFSHLPDSFLKCMKPADKPRGNAGLTTQEASDKGLNKLEREVHKEISNWLRLHGIPCFHARTDKRSTIDVGLPDYALAAAGTPVCLEVKVGGRKLTQEQENFRAQLLANGWHYHVVHSLPDVIAIVHGFLHNDP